MKTQFLFCFIIISSVATAQTYTSSRMITKKSTFESQIFSRTITFNKETIVVSKYLNGMKDDFELKIDKTDEKEYNSENCKWYYCTSVKKDFMQGYTKAIVVAPIYSKKIYLFDFADEVTIFFSQFSID